MEGRPLVELTSNEQFDELIKKTTLTVVHFYADWAVECEPMNNVLLALSKEDDLKDVSFATIAAETFPQLSMNFKISAVPTFLLFVNGKQVDRLDGANAVKLTQIVKSNSAKAKVLEAASAPVISSDIKQAAPDAGTKTDDGLNARLQKLINQSPVVLFMKGSAVAPQCGFSRQAVALLKENQAEFTTFDIFQDEEVRQGLKVYSNWPTYPQLYINGELIGGLDIMKEMAQDGELGEMLNKAKTVIKTESLNDRLKRLTHQTPLMVFMKGDTQVPRCGFSRQLVEILNETKLPYETFDILNDEEVRQGLKTYSNWPTYPQVYVKGELVGGLDIIKELKENGELLSTLQGQ